MRHSIQFIGQIFPILAPFLYIGLYFIVKKRQWFWIYWLLISPIASALTYDGGYHATRLFYMVVPITVAIAYGLYFSIKNLKKQ